jgi:hypothetical protein
VADDDDNEENILQYPKKLSYFILCRPFLFHYLFNVLLNNRFCITVFTVCHSSMNKNNVVYDSRHIILWSDFIFFSNYFMFYSTIFGGGGGEWE